ncbi:rab11 family-interacting protein 3 isoform X2 [Sphaeramia orbicularis]|uniref:RAB11 family interacting protein 3 n=1 Tax=Sphaeramia orbicularis TaxID=375764 RepID=A0A673BYS6_9TELE|nr:rab11 family-interacting protein 3 isoform X2 [Sphaeramia orbicularis]
MEPTVLAGPLGHTQWETEQPFPLGFHTLNSDNGDVLCQNKSGQTGLDFRNGDQDHTHKQSEEEGVYQGKVAELGLINISDYSYGDLQFEGDQTTNSKAFLHITHKEDLSYTEKTEASDEITDSTLSWLFTPNLFDIAGKNTTCEELSPPQEAPCEGQDSDSNQAEIKRHSEPSSSKCSDDNSEGNMQDLFLLVDLFSDEHSCVTSDSPGESDLQSVTEELVDLSQEEHAGLPPSQSTLSPDTGDKGLFPDQVTDLPITSSSTLQGLPENCLPHNHISSVLECFEGSVPLLDLEVPNCDSSVSLCPASPASVICTGAPLVLSTVESEVDQTGATVTQSLTSDHQSETDSSTPGLSAETSSPTVHLPKDAFIQDDFISESDAAENESKDLMEGRISSEAKNLGNEAMALDLCLTADEVHDKEAWDLKPVGLQNDITSTPTGEQMEEEERLTDADHLEGADCHEVGSLDFSIQESKSSSSEGGWTNEQTVETISLSKMVVDDSLPIVSTVNTREEDVSPLKAVFDALDQDGDGFVRIEEFMEFAAAYGADQVKDLTKFLDPSGLGVISFEDFHRGISAISNGGPEPPLYSVNYSPGDGAVGCPEEYDEQNEVTDSAYLGSESTYSECETFTDEDTGALVPPEMHEDVETDSGIEATLHDPEDGGNRFSLNSELHNHSLVTVIGGEEEHFEDFGESNTSELLLETSVEVTEGEGDSPLIQPPEQINGSALLSPSAGKRLSSKKVARHLLQNSSMTLDTMSDLTRDILELADNDITDKVLLLERRVAELEKESEASGEQHARLRQENLQLVHRANAFEEQLKEQELYADEQLQQENRRHKEALSKLERERGLELENLQARLQQLDEENSELRSCVPCLRANIERLEEEKRKLQDETEAMSDRLEEEMESRRKMHDKLSHERHQNQKEKECTQELIEDLRKQLEHLQLYKLEAEAKRGRTPGAGLQEYQTRTREAELEQEIKRLKQDNRSLKEQNDELNGQIINLSIQGAKNLMSASFSDSLAAEINSVSRTELMEAIHKQEEINYRLQDYIDKIIVAIMESNPSILEVK